MDQEFKDHVLKHGEINLNGGWMTVEVAELVLTALAIRGDISVKGCGGGSVMEIAVALAAKQ